MGYSGQEARSQGDEFHVLQQLGETIGPLGDGHCLLEVTWSLKEQGKGWAISHQRLRAHRTGTQIPTLAQQQSPVLKGRELGEPEVQQEHAHMLMVIVTKFLYPLEEKGLCRERTVFVSLIRKQTTEVNCAFPIEREVNPDS